MNILPDLIEVWPLNLDYPLHREFLHNNRGRFSKVIIVFTDMNTDHDYRQFIQDSMAQDNIIFTNSPKINSNEDWRNVAVRHGLYFSDASWVWFTEQDFTPREGFWEIVNDLMLINNVIFVEIGERVHPCCLFTKRDIVDKTSQNFSAKPPNYDHFGLFVKELRDEFIDGALDPSYWHHMNGLSQNMWLLQHNMLPNYNPEEFKEYCRKCLEVETLHPDFKVWFENYVNN